MQKLLCTRQSNIIIVITFINIFSEIEIDYGQEVYFSAPNTLLKKLQSIDSKAIKLAIGVPVHTNLTQKQE